MLHRRAVIGLIASAGTLSGSQIVLAKEKHHNNGNALLGAKIKQNGKHPVGVGSSRKLLAYTNLTARHP